MSLIKISFAFYGNNKDEHEALIKKLKAEKVKQGSGFKNSFVDFSKIQIKEVKNLQPDHAHELVLLFLSS